MLMGRSGRASVRNGSEERNKQKGLQVERERDQRAKITSAMVQSPLTSLQIFATKNLQTKLQTYRKRRDAMVH